MFSLNRGSGEQRWRYRRDPPGGITASGHAGILRVGERIVTGFSDGHVVALASADGSVVWDRDTNSDTETAEGATEAHRLIDVDTTPVEAAGSLFVASHVAGLYALDPAGGGTRWRNDTLRDIAALASDGRDLSAASSSQGLLRIDPTDGTVRWARELGGRGFSDIRRDARCAGGPEDLGPGALAGPCARRRADPGLRRRGSGRCRRSSATGCSSTPTAAS